MAYTPYHNEWKDFPDETTPITADALDHIEEGIEATAAVADGAATDVVVAQTTADGATVDAAAAQADADTAVANALAAQTTANAAIPKAIVDAAGDLIVATGADTVTRLAIGAESRVLGVSGGVPAWVVGTPGPAGPAGTGNSTYEYQLVGSPSAGATSITLDRVPNWIGVNSFVVIDPFTIEAEIRKVTAIVGSTLTVAALTYAHASGDYVFQNDRGLIPWSWWGAKPNSTAFATTNVTAFNRLTNQLYGLGNYYYGGIFVPAGIWYIDNELRMERDQILEGTAVMNSMIKAHTTFSFPNSETYMIHPYRDGVPTTFAVAGPSARWTLRNIYLDGASIAGSNGVLSSPQQPDIWENIRIDNCKGFGAAISDVQQHIIKNFEGINNGISLRMRNVSFVWVDGFNSEQSDTNDILCDCSTGGDFHHIHFENVHLEDTDGGANVKFDGTGAAGNDLSGIVFDHVWVTGGGTDKVFEFAGAATAQEYTLRNVRFYGSPANMVAITDEYRGLALNARNEFADRMLQYQTNKGSLSSASNTAGHHQARWDGTSGASARVGTPLGTSSQPVATFYSNTVGDNEHHARFHSSGTLVFDVNRAGNLKIGSAGSFITSVLVGSTTWDPGSIADGAMLQKDVAVTGAATNMPCFATFTSLGSYSAAAGLGGWLISAVCTSADVVTVTILNKTGGPVDLANGTVRASQVKF